MSERDIRARRNELFDYESKANQEAADSLFGGYQPSEPVKEIEPEREESAPSYENVPEVQRTEDAGVQPQPRQASDKPDWGGYGEERRAGSMASPAPERTPQVMSPFAAEAQARASELDGVGSFNPRKAEQNFTRQESRPVQERIVEPAPVETYAPRQETVRLQQEVSPRVYPDAQNSGQPDGYQSSPQTRGSVLGKSAVMESVPVQSPAGYSAPMGSAGNGVPERGYARNYEPAPQYQGAVLNRPVAGYSTYVKRIIATASPKGGVGKSTIAKELACCYSTKEIDGRPMNVLLVDLNLVNANIYVMFDSLSRYPNIGEWAKKMIADKNALGNRYKERYTAEEIRQYVSPVRDNMDVMCGVVNDLDSKLITKDMVKIMINSMRNLDYDVIVLDTTNSKGSDMVYPIYETVDDVVLIETLDSSTILDTGDLLTDLREHSIDLDKIHFVFNYNNDKGDNDVACTEQDVLNQYPLDYITSLPYEKSMKLTNNISEPLFWSNKKLPFKTAVNEIAEKFIPSKVEKKKGLAALFSFGKKR